MSKSTIQASFKGTLAAAYKKWGDRPYVWTLVDDTYVPETYGAVIGRAYALASELTDSGITGKKIAIFAKNSANWISADYAIALSANIAILMDAAWQHMEAKNALTFTQPDVVFYDNSTADITRKIMPTLPDADFRSIENLPEISRSEIPDDSPSRDPDVPAKIFFSSGTTGMPKASMLSERNMLFGWQEIERRMGDVGPDDTCYVFLPFHHVYANVIILLYALPIGCQLYLAANVKNAKQEMALAKPTILHGVPLFYERIYEAIPKHTLAVAKRLSHLAETLHVPQFIRKLLFSSLHQALGGRLHILISGGAELDSEIHRFFAGAGLFIYGAYGTTETAGLLCSMEFGTHKHASVGAPPDDIELKIDSPSNDGRGEIVAKGPNVFLGYYHLPKVTTAAFDDKGFYHTGDVGYFDNKGVLYVTGRKKRMILLSNGENVWPEEIEKLFEKSSDIKSIRIYEYDESICAKVVIPTAGQKAHASEHCLKTNKSLSKHMRIDHFSFVVYNPDRRIK